MRRFASKVVVATLGLALATVPLAGCGGTGDGSAGTGSGTDTTEVTSDATEDATDFDVTGKRTPTGNADFTTWKTLGDAFAAATEDPSYGCDKSYYVATIPVGEKLIYVVAPLDDAHYKAFDDVELADSDATAKGEAALADVVIEFVDDITDKVLPQSELDALVGKTGQELMGMGYVFSSYTMYGGDETMVTFDKGYYSYEVTFSTKVEESATEDGGESIKGATVTKVESLGNVSNVALDPTMVGKVEVAGNVTGTPAGNDDNAAPATDAGNVSQAEGTGEAMA